MKIKRPSEAGTVATVRYGLLFNVLLLYGGGGGGGRKREGGSRPAPFYTHTVSKFQLWLELRRVFGGEYLVSLKAKIRWNWAARLVNGRTEALVMLTGRFGPKNRLCRPKNSGVTGPIWCVLFV